MNTALLSPAAPTPPAARACLAMRTQLGVPARLVTLALLGAGLAGPAAAQNRDFSKVEIVTTPVAGAVSMLEGAGGNIGVSAGPDGVLIVDDQFEPLAERIHTALDALDGAGSGKPRFVLNTHWHGDHTGGNAVFGKEGTIIAHAAVRKRLAEGAHSPDRNVEPAPAAALPVLTFDSSMSVHFNGEEIRLIHLPHGHTDGDTIVWFTGSNVVHLGDDFFAGRFPFVDLDSGGDVVGLERAVAKLLVELPPDAKLIPGHGPLSTLDDLRKFHEMLLTSIDTVRTRLASGLTQPEVVVAGLPGWESWSWQFIDTDGWLAAVCESLSRTPPWETATPSVPAAPGTPAPPPPAGGLPPR